MNRLVVGAWTLVDRPLAVRRRSARGQHNHWELGVDRYGDPVRQSTPYWQVPHGEVPEQHKLSESGGPLPHGSSIADAPEVGIGVPTLRTRERRSPGLRWMVRLPAQLMDR